MGPGGPPFFDSHGTASFRLILKLKGVSRFNRKSHFLVSIIIVTVSVSEQNVKFVYFVAFNMRPHILNVPIGSSSNVTFCFPPPQSTLWKSKVI